MSVPRAHRRNRKKSRHASFLLTPPKIPVQRPNHIAESCLTVYDIVVRRSEMVSTGSRGLLAGPGEMTLRI
jgi:hypothetical protein